MLQSLLGAITFYTCLPIPQSWQLEFRYVARFAPMVGILIGCLITLLDGLLGTLSMPTLTRSGVVIASWLALTGGLHLDGVMDTADGLAVMDPERRLEVMTDSNTGAFGAMAAVVILGLKVSALADLSISRMPLLLTTAMWGRWAQQIAIANYPYLKPTGKGAFHKAALPSNQYVILNGIGCVFVSLIAWMLLWGVPTAWGIAQWLTILGYIVAIAGWAIATGAWFNAKLGGHTGDTYGAVVEWTEVGTLVLATLCSF